MEKEKNPNEELTEAKKAEDAEALKETDANSSAKELSDSDVDNVSGGFIFKLPGLPY